MTKPFAKFLEELHTKQLAHRAAYLDRLQTRYPSVERGKLELLVFGDLL